MKSASYLFSHHQLLLRTSRSELRSRYAGSMLGIMWAILAPWLLLVLYACVYLLIFRIKVPNLSSVEYVFFVFSGLVPYLMTADALSVGVGSVTTNRDVLENTVFPIDLASPKAVLMGQTAMLAGMPVVIIGSLAIGNGSWTMLLLPLLWGLHILALFGLVWCISLLNVVFRDLQNIIAIILMALLITSPFAYTTEMVPETLKPLILLNPLAYYVIAYQDILLLGRTPSLFIIVFLVVFSVGMFFLGSWFFNSAKRVIIDYV